jgi:glycosyltransferase involved in cell wall biosynthesis
MSKLKFSIITPSYNQGAFIEETICSVLNQSYSNFEYILIDGGSTDQSLDIIRKYADKFTYWISEKDHGQSHALNKGMKKCTGDVLIWINSDDMLLDGALAIAAKYFDDHPEVDVVHGRTMLFQNNSGKIVGADEQKLPQQYLAGMAFSQPSAFIRRSSIERYHPVLDEHFHYGMDYDLFCCLYLNSSFLSVSDVFSKYRLHSSSKTMNTNTGFAEDWRRVFCKMIRSVKNNDQIIRYLKELGMWHEGADEYPVSKHFESHFLLKSFLLFLEFQINFYYRDLDLNSVRRIGRFVKSHFPDFYENNNIRRLHLVTLVPFARYLIPLLRKPHF